MRLREYTTIPLIEASALIGIKDWFQRRYQDKLRNQGGEKVRKFINDHLNVFAQFMGHYQLDWPTVTLFVVSSYMKRNNGLNDAEILEVVNQILIDPTIQGKKVSSKQLMDRQLLLSTLSNAKGNNQQINQLIAEKILAAASMRQLENHWDKQAGIDNNDGSKQSNAQQPNAQQPNIADNVSLDNIDAALKQLGVSVT